MYRLVRLYFGVHPATHSGLLYGGIQLLWPLNFHHDDLILLMVVEKLGPYRDDVHNFCDLWIDEQYVYFRITKVPPEAKKKWRGAVNTLEDSQSEQSGPSLCRISGRKVKRVGVIRACSYLLLFLGRPDNLEKFTRSDLYLAGCIFQLLYAYLPAEILARR